MARIKNDKYITIWQATTTTDVGYYRGKERNLYETKREALESCAKDPDLTSCRIVRKKVKNQNYYFNEFNKLRKK